MTRANDMLGTPLSSDLPPPDRVVIEDLELYARLGLTAEERAYPQRVLLSASVSLKTNKSGTSGELSDSVCYSTAARSFKREAESKEWVLVEELLEALSASLLEEQPAAEEVSLLLKKFAVPSTAWVGVQITRRRRRSAAKAKMGF